jgi:hypothetical protein
MKLFLVTFALVFAFWSQAQTGESASFGSTESVVTFEDLAPLLEENLEIFSEARLWRVSEGLELLIQTSQETLRIVAVEVGEGVNRAHLAASLRALALDLRLRARATPLEERTLDVQVASLVQQSAGLLEERAFRPRLAVELPE